MATFKLELSDELLEVIKNMGFDLESYFTTQFLNPLLEEYKKVKQSEVLQVKKEEIDSKVEEVKNATDLIEAKTIVEEVPLAPVPTEESPKEDEPPPPPEGEIPQDPASGPIPETPAPEENI